MKDIMIGTRIDYPRPWLEKHFNLLKTLDYPKENLRIVYSIKDGPAITSLVEKIKKFKEKEGFNIEVYKEPLDRNILEYGVEMGASIFKDWQEIFEEDYFLLLDSDIVRAPSYLIKELQRVDQPVSIPYIYIEGTNIFYDIWKFRLNNRRFHPTYPPGQGLLVPLEVNSGGGCILIKGEVFKELDIKNPYPTISLCRDAFRRGYRVVGLPYLRVEHEDLRKHRIFHSPLPPELGGYPIDKSFSSSFSRIKVLSKEPMPAYSDLIKYLKRRLLQYEKDIMEEAKILFRRDPILQEEKSLEWTYNILKFQHFYFTNDPIKLMIYYYLEPLPEWFEIEPTTYCNMKCKMCEHTYWNEPNKHMTFEEFKHIFDQFPKVRWIGMTGIGESLMNPDFLKMMEYVKKDPSIYIELFDPFFLTNEKVLKKWVDLSVDKVYVSLDAATPETYAIQRPGFDFKKILNNLKLLDKIKKDHNKHYPRLCFHFIINKYNINDVLEYLDLVKSLNIDVWFIQFTRMLHPFKEVKDMFVHIPDSLKEKVFQKAKKLGLDVRFNANVPLRKPPLYHCSAYIQPFIFVTGHVIPCCCMNEENRRQWQKDTSLGNIFEQSLEEIWYGEKFRDLRKKLYTGQIHEICRRCPLFNVRVEI